MGLGADRGWSESHSLTSCGWVAGSSTSAAPLLSPVLGSAKVTMVAAGNSPDAHHQGDRVWRVTTVAPGCFMSRVLLSASSSFICRCLIWNVSSVRPPCIRVLRLNTPMASSQFTSRLGGAKVRSVPDFWLWRLSHCPFMRTRGARHTGRPAPTSP